MKNIEIDIYMNQFIGFFDKNPKELTELIGKIDKDIFFQKIREQCEKNFEKDGEASLKREQVIEIIVSLHRNDNLTPKIVELEEIFQNTKFGKICLN
jgi:hypothetical protein